MSHEGFTPQHRAIGRTAAWAVFFLGVVYAVTTVLGILMIVSGSLSLVGLIGVPLADMQVRNIGIIGYAVVAPVVFLLLGIVFGRTQTLAGDTEQSSHSRSGA